MSGIRNHTDLHPDRNVYHGPYTCLGSPITRTSTLVGISTCKPFHSVCVVFHMWWDICVPYMCPGSNVISTSTPVAMSIQPAASFCLCCFWQVVRCLWSIPVSGNPHHTNLHPIRNVNPKSWFILSVLFLKGGETSVVPTHVWDPQSHRPQPW